jgi:aspartyl/asparaginyl beta-hydroxylase (cupin superfamily)
MNNNCDYIVKEGFSPKKLNTYNKNDGEGLFLLFMIILNIYFITSGNFKNNIGPILLLCIIISFYVINKRIRLLYIFSALLTLFIRTPPFLNMKEYFSENELFENNFEEIKKEVNQLLEDTNNGNKIDFTRDTLVVDEDKDKNIRNKNNSNKNDEGWKIYPIRLASKNVNTAKHNFPKLTELLDQCPHISSCLVSILDGKTYIPVHNGYYKGFLRYMLPITIPKEYPNEVFLCNNYQKYNWVEGKGVLWDDLYPHKVYNNTSQKRIVLYMDVERKLPTPFNILNKKIINLISKSSRVKEEVKRLEKKYKL